jgi:hypothetical protein
MKFILSFFLCFISLISVAQLRYTKLEIERGQTFAFGQSDILVVDTLVMRDSSSIVLNRLRKENYLYAKVVIIGNACSIKGIAQHGKNGKPGRAGLSSNAPCKNAVDGEEAQPGAEGGHATHLLLYVKEIQITHPLSIFLTGGNGGNGGTGGDGGSGGGGTLHCNGGSGGKGGKGGSGANGGNGGDLMINMPLAEQKKIKTMVKIFLKAGTYGRGGNGGYSGSAGLGPKGKHGKSGMQGEDGSDGSPGIDGTIRYFDY